MNPMDAAWLVLKQRQEDEEPKKEEPWAHLLGEGGMLKPSESKEAKWRAEQEKWRAQQERLKGQRMRNLGAMARDQQRMEPASVMDERGYMDTRSKEEKDPHGLAADEEATGGDYDIKDIMGMYGDDDDLERDEYGNWGRRREEDK